jgi:hypothetical protein
VSAVYLEDVDENVDVVANVEQNVENESNLTISLLAALSLLRD